MLQARIEKGPRGRARASTTLGLAVFLFQLSFTEAAAQEHAGHPAEHARPGAGAPHGESPDTTAARRAEPSHAGHPAMQAHATMQAMQMMQGPLGLSPAREGSGTSWLPDASPMYAVHRTAGIWELMLHGKATLQYVDDGSERGEQQFGSVNWFMAMARRELAGGRLTLRAMTSLDPLTVGKCGYPDLLATGEFCHDEPLHDRQHPHDLFMELVGDYERPLSENIALQVYAGPVGEPALGPVSYPHRISSMPSPLAPIAHHWLDSTHISFGVVTAGVFGRTWKVEGSLFNGREPDEDRYDIDLDRLDSWAGRLWWAPTARWIAQASVGRLNEAEPAREGEPPTDVTRPTASLTYHRPLLAGGVWATTVAWGENVESTHTTHAFLLESSLDLGERHLVFGRGEIVGKTGKDLALEGRAAAALLDRTFVVATLSLGYVQQLGAIGGLAPGVGARASLNLVPPDLEPFYGSTTALGLAVFANLRATPVAMETGEHRDGSRRLPNHLARTAIPS